jgi:hypothetical protein
MLMVASGLGLLIVSVLPQVAAEVFWVRRDFEVIWLQAPAGGPKLWIMIRMLQMGIPTAANVAASLGLLLHLLAVSVLTWPVVNQTRAMRRMGIGLRALVIIGMLYWLALAVWVGRSKTNANDIKWPALAWVTVLDEAGVLLTGWFIAGVARRGGYRRIAKVIETLTVVQAAGLGLLFVGIYIANRVEDVLWSSLLLHAAGGAGLTIISIWLIFKLAGVARATRTNVLENDEEKRHGLN